MNVKLDEIIDRLTRIEERQERMERALVVIAECVEPEEEDEHLTLDGQPAGQERRAGDPL